MPDSISNESMRQGITCICMYFFVCLCVLLLFFVCFCFLCACVRGDTSCFPQGERDGISFITITSVGGGKS